MLIPLILFMPLLGFAIIGFMFLIVCLMQSIEEFIKEKKEKKKGIK